MSKWRWQDYLNVLFGAWLVVMPWTLGLVDTHPLATWNAVITGGAIAVLAAADMEILSTIEESVLIALGAWAIASPWVFGLAGMTAATMGMVIPGLAVIVLTTWELAGTSLLQKWREHAHG